MATIYQRGKIWWGRFQYRRKEFRTSLETPSRSIALRRLAVWERKTKASAWGEGKGHTYDEAMESFLDNHCPTLRPSSKLRYVTSAAKLTAFFSETALTEIKSAKLAQYEARRRAEGAHAARLGGAVSSRTMFHLCPQVVGAPYIYAPPLPTPNGSEPL